MLIKASVENFLSFDEPTELPMISSNKIRTIPEHKMKINGTSVLKYAVVYGANAAGKSNLIELFRFFKYCVRNQLPIQCVTMFCRNKQENEMRDSSFELQISIGGKFYAYGFSAVLSSRTITGEWLYELSTNGTAQKIFTRDACNAPVWNSSLKLSKEELIRFQTYASDFEDNTTKLFLTEMNSGKKIASDSQLMIFKTIYTWIAENLNVFTPNTSVTDFSYYFDSESLATVSRLIQTFDTGITDIRIEETSLDEIRRSLPKTVYEDFMNTLRTRMEQSGKLSMSFSVRCNTDFYNIQMKNDAEPTVTTIRMRHGNPFYHFSFGDESDGTRRLFDLLDMLLTQHNDAVYVVDELERSLHPKLTEHFLELFGKRHLEQRIQLIFTTHESSIMDQSLFRRDEFWFVERDNQHNSKLYSLDRFKERYDKVLSKAYLEGRYGAIPVFSVFEELEEE